MLQPARDGALHVAETLPLHFTSTRLETTMLIVGRLKERINVAMYRFGRGRRRRRLHRYRPPVRSRGLPRGNGESWRLWSLRSRPQAAFAAAFHWTLAKKTRSP